VKFDTASEIIVHDATLFKIKGRLRPLISGRVESLEQHINIEQTERDLVELAARLNTREDYIACEQFCDKFIESLDEHSRIKPRLSIGNRQLLVARLQSLKYLVDLKV